MTELAIHRLTTDDLERLVALENCQLRPWSRRQLEAALSDAGCLVLGAEMAGRLVGHAVVARLPFEAELQAMLVAPDMRRRGLAAALLETTIEQCRQWGSERLLLEVRAGNVPALELYRHAGFGEDGRRRGYYPPLEEAADARREDAVLMSRRP
ncbi:ribosomal protein S18-alanine N-acetyltransferase [Halomonas sp. MCCC 1A17488]|uniref:ribosomal protein S18-alanine N-acetyltransferase n=1 Tax=unclassified Halomonas TaxID=2609666 RepID=UPI0018D23D70|nr:MULTISPECIES: ribosomal protein S18-alanine N-acetyltransferase [unclassified Halomonas]MCE8016784.1 ribosomal protein S18-alanine N-acetyltransferase [Halomonas sp. MCCC 1A17488]MCG3240117.1 ribosomal protein S18-alanine N-acetyltransferase [Halomonas sp. MCCC 1A17488]QPP50002.1 ribosomal protein S18-alanine N-acetyltransferase [Halomonas sp. SS10-MC5]